MAVGDSGSLRVPGEGGCQWSKLNGEAAACRATCLALEKPASQSMVAALQRKLRGRRRSVRATRAWRPKPGSIFCACWLPRVQRIWLPNTATFNATDWLSTKPGTRPPTRVATAGHLCWKGAAWMGASWQKICDHLPAWTIPSLACRLSRYHYERRVRRAFSLAALV
jgi:hypothetical protein